MTTTAEDPAELADRRRDASARLRAAATLAADAASTVWPGPGIPPELPQAVYDVACDLRDLAKELAVIQRDLAAASRATMEQRRREGA